MRKVVLILLGVLALCTLPDTADASCSSSDRIARVYVIRRNLSLFRIRWRLVAHSGLILQMRDGHQCVLEYLEDGLAHIYDANPISTRNCWFGRRCKVLRMRDNENKMYTWTRQKYGTAFPSHLGSVTPQDAQTKMQSLMGYNYNVLTNNCHKAQEKLRRAWGMRV